MKNYLVIGASSGIGKELAEQLQSSGHNVIGTYNETTPPNNGITYEHLNVLEDELDLDFAPEVLDGIAYCPGSIDLKPFHRIGPDKFKADFDLQVLGAIKVIQGVLPAMKKSEQASVVLFSTIAVQNGFPFHSMVASSKGALEGLTKSLAAEYAPKLRVNCIAPSLTNTPLASRLLSNEDKIEANAQRHPLKAIGEAKDIADTASFLLTDKSKWMTGQVIHLDGGLSTLKV